MEQNALQLGCLPLISLKKLWLWATVRILPPRRHNWVTVINACRDESCWYSITVVIPNLAVWIALEIFVQFPLED